MQLENVHWVQKCHLVNDIVLNYLTLRYFGIVSWMTEGHRVPVLFIPKRAFPEQVEKEKTEGLIHVKVETAIRTNVVVMETGYTDQSSQNPRSSRILRNYLSNTAEDRMTESIMNYFKTSLTSKPLLPQRSPQNWPLFAKKIQV